MAILIDSHVFIWMTSDDPQISGRAREAILNEDRILLSIVSVWELAIKYSLGKLWPTEDDFGKFISDSIQLCGVEILPITVTHTVALTSLPMHHRDPFDRMLIAQSIAEGIPIVTHDSQIREYACEVVW